MQKAGGKSQSNSYRCEYKELARNSSELIESAKISHCEPNTLYKIFIAKLFKADDGDIVYQSNREGPIDVTTMPKSDGRCYNELTVRNSYSK